MSNIYIQEPPTHGKVLVQTTVGDIDIELWSKETPKACRNFVQLCLEGYYDNTIFHRVVKDFIAQGGDPTGTGHGGESVYGKPFRDEFHSRLRFNRRGLVAMANAGPNDNGSQFFFTLGPAPELDKKHTLFGKVAGPTLYNMLKLGDVETDSNERPSYPPSVTRTKVLLNPFEDIEPRAQPKRHRQDEARKRKNKSRATKNFSLLSFGEEAEEDEEEVNKVSQDLRTKGKSSHDLLKDERLSTTPAVDTVSQPDGTPETRATHSESGGSGSGETDSDSDPDADTRRHKKLKTNPTSTAREESVPAPGGETSKPSRLEELKKEAKQLRRELQKSNVTAETESAKVKKKPQNEIISAYEEERQKYEDRKMFNKKSQREKETLSLLAKFQTRLSSVRRMATYSDEEEEDQEVKEDEEEDFNDPSWMNHKLQFESSDRKVLDANVQEEDRYEIFDPRNPLNKRRREASKQSLKDKR